MRDGLEVYGSREKAVMYIHEAVVSYGKELAVCGKPRKTTLIMCEPLDSWFIHLDETNHHGKSHVAQLLDLSAHAYPFIRSLGLDVDMEVIGWTCILHDIAQYDMSRTAMEIHASIAANWAEKHLQGIVNKNKLQKIIHTIANHAVAMDTGDMTPELRLFRSMDAVALVRLGRDVQNFHLPIIQLEEGHFMEGTTSLPVMALQLDENFKQLEKKTRAFEKEFGLGENRYQQMIYAGMKANLILPW
jgi:hypothetical protein